METLFLYLIVFGIFVVIVGGYCLVKHLIFKNKPNQDKANKIYVLIVAILASVFLFAAYFVQPGAMRPNAESATKFKDGCVFLTGVPYGDNKAANFFAWFQIFLFFPAAIGTILAYFYKFKIGDLLSKFILLPLLLLNSTLFFNLCNAMCGSCTFDYKSILLATAVGLVTALGVCVFFDHRKEKYEMSKRDVFHFIGLFVFSLIMFLPAYSSAVLLPSDLPFFDKPISNHRIQDLTFMHRLFIYGVLIIPIATYFIFRNTEEKERTFVLLVISFAALLAFTIDFSFNDIFKPSGIESPMGTIYIDVKKLPLHLCHTAVYIVPITIITKSKRLFYFTYFINVFGAMMAVLMPNVGSDSSPLDPSLWSYWANHMCALMMPLLCVAMKVFERPKMKQMGYSLAYFAGYFVIILFLNAWLSNYVQGYDPNKIGTGTDYLFINGTFLLDKLGSNAKTFFLKFTLGWNWGNFSFQFYPLYQAVFFLAYVVIAFAMWFVYSLFFRIADSHYVVHERLKVAKLNHFSFKDLRRKEVLDMNKEDRPAKLEFIHFSKRYGSSTVLSANDVNLSISGGEIFGFLGPNGAGKSTSIKTAIGIQPITEGEILVCGYSVKDETVKAKSEIGYVPDHYALYEKLTGREYINYIADLYHVSKEDRDERIDHYVQLLELTQAFDNRMQTYSHGMKQKITIMAALIHNPKVWILDEPLTGLDPQSIYQVKQCMINHAAKGNIVFFSSHIIDVVEKLCTRIAIIKKGHIVYENDMQSLEKEHPEGLEAFYMKVISE